MSDQLRLSLHAARVFAKRRIQETLLAPGFYVAQTIGLALAWLLVIGFVRSVDSSGFSYRLAPAYDLLGRGLAGAFGETFVAKLFAEGPFLLALHVAFLPVLLHLSVSSVFRFGLERKVGALELLTCGPADGTSWFLAALVKDLSLTAAYGGLLLLFLTVAAREHNLVLGPAFFSGLAVMLFLALALYAYGTLASALTDNPAAALGLFLGGLLLFMAVQTGSLALVGTFVRNLASVVATAVQWVSPLYYWNLAAGFAEVGAWGRYLLSIAALAALAGAALFVARLTLGVRGVRG